MEQQATNYMELNSSAQQAEMARRLRWNWSPEARQALTKYHRAPEQESPTEELEQELMEVLGHAPPALLEVQRELGGISIDYGRNHSLDFGLVVHPETLRDEGIIQLSLESNGCPEHFIDAQGKVLDDDYIFSDTQKLVEWYVALRNFYFHTLGQNPVNVEFTVMSSRELSRIMRSAATLAKSLRLSAHPYASDGANVLWLDKFTRFTINIPSYGGMHLSIYTAQAEVADMFTEWWKRQDF